MGPQGYGGASGPTDNVVNPQVRSGPGPIPPIPADAATLTGISAQGSPEGSPSPQHFVLDAEPGLFGANPPDILPPVEAVSNVTMDNFTTKGRIKTKHANKIIIRNKAQLIREASVLIAVLQEALDFRQVDRDNRPIPELCRQLNLQDAESRKLIEELVAELKRLNDFIASNRRARPADKKTISQIEKVGYKVLTVFGSGVAAGAALLTLGAVCTILDHIGAHEVVENAMIWKKIGK